MGRHKPSLCTAGNLAKLPAMREAGWLAPWQLGVLHQREMRQEKSLERGHGVGAEPALWGSCKTKDMHGLPLSCFLREMYAAAALKSCVGSHKVQRAFLQWHA